MLNCCIVYLFRSSILGYCCWFSAIRFHISSEKKIDTGKPYWIVDIHSMWWLACKPLLRGQLFQWSELASRLSQNCPLDCNVWILQDYGLPCFHAVSLRHETVGRSVYITNMFFVFFGQINSTLLCINTFFFQLWKVCLCVTCACAFDTAIIYIYMHASPLHSINIYFSHDCSFL